jgi:hypothetical protein
VVTVCGVVDLLLGLESLLLHVGAVSKRCARHHLSACTMQVCARVEFFEGAYILLVGGVLSVVGRVLGWEWLDRVGWLGRCGWERWTGREGRCLEVGSAEGWWGGMCCAERVSWYTVHTVSGVVGCSPEL